MDADYIDRKHVLGGDWQRGAKLAVLMRDAYRRLLAGKTLGDEVQEGAELYGYSSNNYNQNTKGARPPSSTPEAPYRSGLPALIPPPS